MINNLLQFISIINWMVKCNGFIWVKYATKSRVQYSKSPSWSTRAMLWLRWCRLAEVVLRLCKQVHAVLASAFLLSPLHKLMRWHQPLIPRQVWTMTFNLLRRCFKTFTTMPARLPRMLPTVNMSVKHKQFIQILSILIAAFCYQGPIGHAHKLVWKFQAASLNESLFLEAITVSLSVSNAFRSTRQGIRFF